MPTVFIISSDFQVENLIKAQVCTPILSADSDKDALTVTTEYAPARSGCVVTRKVKNTSSETVSLVELQTVLSGISFGKSPEKDYFYVNENPRIYGQYTLPVDFDREHLDNPANARFGLTIDTSLADPGVICKRILSCPYQPFPAILLSNYETSAGLIFGSLSQDVFYHTYELSHVDGTLSVNLISAMKDIDARRLLPGEELVDRFYVGITGTADDINNIFGAYTDELRVVLRDACGRSEQNRHTMLWDSWNDGIFRDISEDMLLGEARAVKRLFPNVEWFQVDDGYSAYCEKNVDLDAHGLGVPYEGDAGIDQAKFPNGIRHYTDEVRAIGLRPAVWIGGWVPVKAKLYRDHPEWFIDYRYRLDFAQPLDISIPEAKAYMESAVKTFVEDYGFEGIKHDFWSYAFEDRHPLYRNNDKSGYEYRELWTSYMRHTLGNGYIQTGCDVSMGNPFIGKYFNNYRFGEDVAAGIWDRVLTTMLWGVACLSPQTGDLFIPNSDSVGMLPNLSDRDFMFVVNFQIVTRSLVEISGRFSRVDGNSPRLAVIKRATQYLNNGEKVWFAKFDYRRKDKCLPPVIYIKSAFDGPAENVYTVALFNPTEEETTVTLSPADLGLAACTFTEVWSDSAAPVSALCETLAPHESKLYYARF